MFICNIGEPYNPERDLFRVVGKVIMLLGNCIYMYWGYCLQDRHPFHLEIGTLEVDTGTSEDAIVSLHTHIFGWPWIEVAQSFLIPFVLSWLRRLTFSVWNICIACTY